VRIIVRGIPGTAMPPSSFSEGQVTTIVAYLRSMTASSAPIGTAQGDARRGQSVFEGKGQCLSCHSVNGNGSRLAANLTEVGGVRRAAELERSLVEPAAEVRAENRTVRALRLDGTVLTGRLLNQDTFSIQFLDANERLVSIDKANLREIRIEKTSPMPSYLEKLSLQELADVVSYLTTLRGRQ
jgi:putative heme-binding domain-containing protein